MLFPNISSENLVLKNIFSSDVSMEYVGWLTNPLINQFLEVRHQKVTLDTQKKFVEEILTETTRLGLKDFYNKPLPTAETLSIDLLKALETTGVFGQL